ncbi:hypothetical protein [Haloferula sp.]|uniref:hypothetical protein n=1 Tax=Haloferula sp. TaxID=2497595 RepID=UPI00329AD653
MKTHSSEQAPALPAALLEDLTRSVAIQPAEQRESHFARVFESFRSMVGSSSFGTAAAAIAVLAVASSVVLRPDASPSRQDTFRGASAYSAADTTRVFLVGAPAGTLTELESTTDFEDGVFSSAATLLDTADLKGARVIVDFQSGVITGINTKGESVYHTDVPETSSGLALEIASVLTRL